MLLNNVDLLEELLLSDNGFLISLRMGDGLKADLVDEICKVLDELANEWKNIDSIPKKAVDLFVDFYIVLVGSEGLYSEKEFDEIFDAGDKILSHIRACYCNWHDLGLMKK